MSALTVTPVEDDRCMTDERTTKECTIDDCAGPQVARGWCSLHYQRWKRNGDPTKNVREYGTYRHVGSNGYVVLRKAGHPRAGPDGRVYEHIFVVHEAGIEIPYGHEVHHINGDKADNRLANLVVLSHQEHRALHVAEYLSALGYGDTCSVDGCEDDLKARGMCNRHYRRALREGG